MRFLWVLLLILCCSNQASAAELTQPKFAKTTKPTTLILDSSKVALRKFDTEAIQRYSQQKEFIYDDVAPQKMSWIDRFWAWFWQQISKIFRSGKSTGGFAKVIIFILKWVLVAAFAGLLVYLVLKIFGLDLKIFTGRSKAIEVPYEESLENIHEIDFDDQIELALAQSNHRLAVRLLYLKTLKLLSDKGLIDWKAEKTNQKYVLEISHPETQTQFAKLTNQFEYIWYGEFFVDKPYYEQINNSFLEFNKLA